MCTAGCKEVDGSGGMANILALGRTNRPCPAHRMAPSTMSLRTETRNKDEDDLERGEAAVGASITPSSSSENEQRAVCLRILKDYYNSKQWLELLACGLLSLLFHAVFYFNPSVRMRPLPVELTADGLYLKNQMFNFKYDGETIPGPLHEKLLVIPALLQLFLSLLFPKLRKRCDWHRTACVYLVATAITNAATHATKLYIGYFRPVFFDRCEPNADFSECTAGGGSIREGFPSSHASMSYVNVTLLALFIHHRFGVKSRRCCTKRDAGDSQDEDDECFVPDYTSGNTIWPMMLARLWSLVALVPYGVALYISCTRVVDNMHFPVDILGGAVLGLLIGAYVHGMWFP